MVGLFPNPNDNDEVPIRSMQRALRLGLIEAHEVRQALNGHPKFVKKLQLSSVLRSHQGCVNTIDWNQSGSLLVSGSDDKNIVVWNSLAREITKFASGHTGNIFAAKFLRECNDSKIVSGAADGAVIVNQWRGTDGGAAARLREWNEYRRVKQIALNVNCPTTFYSCSEDGFLAEYDIRSPEASVLLDVHRAIKSIATNPVRPEQIAAGIADDGVKLFDLRNMSVPLLTFASASTIMQRQKQRNNSITYLEFNKRGTELVVNVHNDGVYVFNALLSDENDPGFVQRLDELYKTPISGELQAEPESFLPLDSSYDPKRIEARGYYLVDHYNKALEILNEAICKAQRARVHDQNNVGLKAELALLYLGRGDVLMKREYDGDLMEATRDYIRSLECFLYNSKAHMKLCMVLEAQSQFSKAKKWHSQFLERYQYTGEPILKYADKVFSASVKRWNTLTMAGIRDYHQRFLGAVNLRTDIKQARFFGGKDEYILAGSDCGNMFVFERATGNIVKLLKADAKVLNCVVPHPFSTLIATSGIENVIRFWTPFDKAPAELLPELEENWRVRDQTSSALEIVRENQTTGLPNYISNVEVLMRLAQLRTRQDSLDVCRTS